MEAGKSGKPRAFSCPRSVSPPKQNLSRTVPRSVCGCCGTKPKTVKGFRRTEHRTSAELVAAVAAVPPKADATGAQLTGRSLAWPLMIEPPT